MPKRKEVKPLKNLCSSNVVHNLDYWIRVAEEDRERQRLGSLYGICSTLLKILMNVVYLVFLQRVLDFCAARASRWRICLRNFKPELDLLIFRIIECLHIKLDWSPALASKLTRLLIRVNIWLTLLISSIIGNLEFWIRKWSVTREDREQQGLDGPFDGLPSTILGQFMDEVNPVLLRSGLGRRAALASRLRLVLAPNLQSCELNFNRGYQEDDIERVANIVANRCPELKKFVFEHYELAIGLFSIMIPSMTKLEVLVVVGSNCFRDEALVMLSKYCPNLRELNVSRCPITDAGVAALCGLSCDLFPCKMMCYVIGMDLRGCKLIHHLVIRGTQVTQRGIKMALSNLPRLTFLDHETVVRTLADLERDGHKYPLTYLPLYAIFGLFPAGILARAMDHVHLSSITKVEFSFCGPLRNEVILPLTGLNNLQELVLHDFRPIFPMLVLNPQVTFTSAIRPVLEAVGRTLKKLELENFTVDLNVIANLCPLLESIGLDKCRSFSLPSAVAGNFQKLQKIEIISDSLHNISLEDYDFLFSSPALVEIYVTSERPDRNLILNDGVFERAGDLHRFRHLKVLVILFCPHISRHIIERLLNEETPLNRLKLDNMSVTRDDVEEWNQRGVDENWDLKLEY